MGFPDTFQSSNGTRFTVPNQRRGPNARAAHSVFGATWRRNGQFNGNYRSNRERARLGACWNGACLNRLPVQPAPTFTARPPFVYPRP